MWGLVCHDMSSVTSVPSTTSSSSFFEQSRQRTCRAKRLPCSVPIFLFKPQALSALLRQTFTSNTEMYEATWTKYNNWNGAGSLLTHVEDWSRLRFLCPLKLCALLPLRASVPLFTCRSKSNLSDCDCYTDSWKSQTQGQDLMKMICAGISLSRHNLTSK